MKRLLMSIVGLLALLPMKADEGMWTLYNLPQAVYDQMKAYGYSLPYESLYSGNNPIKGSVVLFGGFCSGVVVSPSCSPTTIVVSRQSAAILPWSTTTCSTDSTPRRQKTSCRTRTSLSAS